MRYFYDGTICGSGLPRLMGISIPIRIEMPFPSFSALNGEAHFAI